MTSRFGCKKCNSFGLACGSCNLASGYGSKKRSGSGSKKRSGSGSKKLKRSKRRLLKQYRPERGCTNQSSYKKYRTRPGPPYPANLCRRKTKIGNDKKRYKSEQRGRSRVFRWYKV